MAHKSKHSISLREKLVALIAALTLAYTAWGLGGVVAWSLHIMLAGGLLTLGLALVPMPGGQRAGDKEQGAPRRKMTQSHTTFLRAPAFYFITAFLLYLVISALNPAWQVVSDKRGWWLESTAPPLAAWLPTSIASPYEPMNAWRIFSMHLAAFSLALGLKIGLKHRGMLLAVLWAFIISGVTMAMVAIVQHFDGAEKVLWTMGSENPRFWGSFFYRNQGVAFLYWVIVIAGVLYFYHLYHSRERGRSGGPHLLAFALIGVVLLSNAFALSRAGILIAAALVAAFVGLVVLDFLVHFIRSRHSWKTTFLVGVLTSLLIATGSYLIFKSVDWESLEDRFEGSSQIKTELKTGNRVELRTVTLEMAQDNLWTGWGAGSFRYAFPMYQQKYPDLFYSSWLVYEGKRGRDFYRYAHNDIVQFLAEYGVIGSALLILSVLSLLLPALRLHACVLGLFLLLGVICICTHAFLDFIFHSPSVWVALIGSIGAVGRLVQLDSRRA